MLVLNQKCCSDPPVNKTLQGSSAPLLGSRGLPRGPATPAAAFVYSLHSLCCPHIPAGTPPAMAALLFPVFSLFSHLEMPCPHLCFYFIHLASTFPSFKAYLSEALPDAHHTLPQVGWPHPPLGSGFILYHCHIVPSIHYYTHHQGSSSD